MLHFLLGRRRGGVATRQHFNAVPLNHQYLYFPYLILRFAGSLVNHPSRRVFAAPAARNRARGLETASCVSIPMDLCGPFVAVPENRKPRVLKKPRRFYDFHGSLWIYPKAIYCQIIDACQPGSVAMRKAIGTCGEGSKGFGERGCVFLTPLGVNWSGEPPVSVTFCFGDKDSWLERGPCPV